MNQRLNEHNQSCCNELLYEYDTYLHAWDGHGRENVYLDTIFLRTKWEASPVESNAYYPLH
jgi:hypothetical protein